MERRIKFFTALPLVMLAVSILAATTIRFETGLTPIERALLALEPERVELAGPRPVRVVRRVSSPIRKIVKRVAPAPAGRKAVKAPEVPDREAGQERAAAGPPAPAAPEVRPPSAAAVAAVAAKEGRAVGPVAEAPVEAPPAAAPDAADRAAPTAAAPPAPALDVSLIVVGARQSMAIVNGEVVREGDRLDGGIVVTRIERDGLLVDGVKPRWVGLAGSGGGTP